MKKKIKIFLMAVCMMLGLLAPMAVQAETVTYSGSNINSQNYSRYASTVKSYLTECEDGTLMRVQYVASEDCVVAEYYDSDYQLLSTKVIPQELSIFGGFYATDTNYFLLTGQTNMDESADVEVYRITKYDKNWNRIASDGLYNCNTTIPFDAGSARMNAYGKYLLIRTSHEMYTSSDGYNHQANVTIQVDMDSTKITDSYTKVMNSNYGYVSHSFNQFIKVENGKIVAVDHGDAYPRSIVLSNYATDVTSGTFTPSYSKTVTCTNVLTFPGTAGENTTGATVGGFEISDTSYLIAGNSVVQDDSNLTRSTRNIYLASVNKSTKAVTMNWITSYEEGDTTTRTPQLVKISDTEFMLLWTRGNHVYYVKCDGKGQMTSDIYCMMDAAISDCVPIVKDNAVLWYTWDDETVIFYEIGLDNIVYPEATIVKYGMTSTKTFCGDLNHNIVSVDRKEPGCYEDGYFAHWGCSVCGAAFKDAEGNEAYSQTEIIIPAAHKYEVTETVDGVAHLVCSVCGDETDKKVPTSLTVYWNYNGGSGYYSTAFTKTVNVGDLVYYWMQPSPTDYEGDINILASDPDIIKYTSTSDTMGYFTVLKPGTVDVTMVSSLNPSVTRTYTFTIPCGDIHNWNTSMSHDETNHWYECSACGEKKEEAAHSGGTATSTQKAVCTICGAEYGDYASSSENPFVDVAEYHYYYQPVLWAVDQGIASGLTTTVFGAESECTRGQAVTFLWRAAGQPTPTKTENPFTDVSAGAYYYNAVLWAVENGITAGYTTTTFAPEMECTRGQIVTFLWRTAGCPDPVSTSCDFPDVTSGAYYYNAVLWAVENGITSGYGNGTFAPEGVCTRGQIVSFLYRHYN